MTIVPGTAFFSYFLFSILWRVKVMKLDSPLDLFDSSFDVYSRLAVCTEAFLLFAIFMETMMNCSLKSRCDESFSFDDTNGPLLRFPYHTCVILAIMFMIYDDIIILYLDNSRNLLFVCTVVFSTVVMVLVSFTNTKPPGQKGAHTTTTHSGLVNQLIEIFMVNFAIFWSMATVFYSWSFQTNMFNNVYDSSGYPLQIIPGNEYMNYLLYFDSSSTYTIADFKVARAINSIFSIILIACWMAGDLIPVSIPAYISENISCCKTCWSDSSQKS